MTEMLLLLSGIAAGALRIFIGLVLIHRLLAAQKPGGKSAAAGSAGALILAILPVLINVPPFRRIAMETLSSTGPTQSTQSCSMIFTTTLGYCVNSLPMKNMGRLFGIWTNCRPRSGRWRIPSGQATGQWTI